MDIYTQKTHCQIDEFWIQNFLTKQNISLINIDEIFFCNPRENEKKKKDYIYVLYSSIKPFKTKLLPWEHRNMIGLKTDYKKEINKKLHTIAE